ncbi:hypothetical protein ACLX1H_005528 [Fusarium chlamydosporum]
MPDLDLSSSDGPTASRALLIGCPAPDLPAVEGDLGVMRCILEGYGFVCTELQHATRADIFEAWDQLIEETSRNDAVTIYYSGHGGFSQTLTTDQDGHERRPLQYLVPVDFQDTTENDWRGITDVELSEQLLKTTKKTDNVTIILDCCHAARMARSPGRIKSINPNDYQQVIQHIETMQTQGRFTGELHHERNPSVLTISASSNTGAAYERAFDGVEMSCLVHALSRFLARGGDADTETTQAHHPSWRTVMLGVQKLMKVTSPHQFPQIEGNDRRLAFRLIEADLDGALSVSRDEDSTDTVLVNGGSVHGLKPNDVYSLQPQRNERAVSGHEITKLTVTHVGPIMSRACLEPQVTLTQDQWDQGLRAFLLSRRRLERLPVALQGAEIPETFQSSVDNSRYLTVMNNGDIMAKVECRNSRIQLISYEGNISTLLGDWRLQEAQSVDHVWRSCFNRLESLARARHVLTLDNGETTPLFPHVEVEIGTVGKKYVRRPWSEDATCTTIGDRIYLNFNNKSSSPVYAWVFSICGEKVELISRAAAYGYQIPSMGNYVFGKRDYTNQLVGSAVGWPSEIPKGSGALSETILVIIGDGSTDLRGLETNAGVSRGPDDLGKLIEELSTICSRDTEPETRQH